MDAAQTNNKKFAFFLALAPLLMAPLPAFAQATLMPNTTSVTIGSSACNMSQIVQLTSSDGSNLQFTAAVQYSSGNLYGNWLYTNVSGSGTTSTSTPFTASTGTGAAGVSLNIGLNSSIGAASPTANVVLTPTNGSPAVSITVFYTQNSTCGGNTGSLSNNFITVTPGNIALTANQNGQQSQTLAIQNLVPSSLTFGYSVQPANQWLSVSANSTTVSPNGTTPITVTGDATKVSSTGTYSGNVTITPGSGGGTTITVPVTFVVTNGTTQGGGGGTSTGTLTVNGASSNTFTTTFSELGGSSPGSQCVPLQDSAPGINSYTYAVTTSNGGNWLLANFNLSGTTTGLIGPSNNACVSLSPANVAASLPSGLYNGQVLLTSGSGSTATINVTLFVSGGTAPGVSVFPGSVFTYANEAVGSTALQQQVFSFTVGNNTQLGTASQVGTNGCAASTNWFTMTTPTASGNTESFTGTANPTGLQAGVYCTLVTMQSTGTNGNSGGTSSILIVLPVGQGTGGIGGSGGGTTGGNTTSLVQPTALTFQQQSTSTFWTSGRESQTITITGQPGTQWSAGIIYGNGASNWLTFDSPQSQGGTFGTGPASLVVDLFNGVNSLQPSSTPYTATVSISTPGGTYTVGVSLLVTPANSPVLLGLPSLATLTTTTAVPTSSAVIQIVGSDNTASGTSPIISAGAPTAAWLTATTTGNSLTVNVNSAGLSTGVYYGTIPITTAAYSNSLSYPVVLVVNGGGSGSASGPLSLSSSSLTFTNVTGQISQTLNMTAGSSTNVTASSTEGTCTTQNWLSISPTGALTASLVSTPITVTVNPSGIATGNTCTGSISFATSSATQTVTVSMTVGTSTSGGNVTVSPLSMTFNYTQGQTAPAPQTATVVNAISGTAGIPFTVVAAVQNVSTNWLQVNAQSGTTPYNNPGLSVTAVPGNLGSGTYLGTVTITPTGGTAQVIQVTLNVSSSVTVTASPTTLSLAYTVGGTSPSGTIQVSGGGASAAFTATAASSANWLTVTPGSGTTPNTGTFNLTAGINASVLSTLTPASSPYTGTITVQGSSPATGTTIINVTLTVTAPLPTILSVINAASGATGAVSPGELISLFANAATNPIGPTTPGGVALSSTTCPSPCTQVPTTMGGVQVIFFPLGIAAPLTYVSAGQINAVVPYEVAGLSNVSVEVKFLGQSSNAFSLSVASVAPGIFTFSGGVGQAAVAQYDASGTFQGINSNTSPAKQGWILAIYMTGEGSLVPAAKTGAVTAVPETPSSGAPVVRIGNQPTTVAGYAEAPGLVSGVLQVNAIVPGGAGTGNVSLTVSLGSGSAQQGVTVFLQ